MNLPFRFIQKTDIEKWRAATFWEKEPETIAWINSFDRRGMFIDVGANVGVYSLYCATLFPDMTVVAFEPSRINAARLEENVNLNNRENIIVRNIALSDRVGYTTFDDVSELQGSSGGQFGNEKGYVVNTSSLDASFARLTYNMSPRPFVYIKIDVDGTERKIIEGGVELLHRLLIRSVLIEVEKNSDDEKFICYFMALKGFSENNEFNQMENHSRYRRAKEGINVENIVFTRG